MTANDILLVPESEFTPFDDVDLFNYNRLTGRICQRKDHRYGALVIETVNGRPALQYIYGTPKMHYPFAPTLDPEERAYRFPPITSATFYEKVDGTNILAYRYYDADGIEYITYKTRLTAVLRQSRFGDWHGLWSRMIAQYPDIPNLVDLNEGMSISFELYGSGNPHLVSYSTPLDTKILFAVTPNGKVLPPDRLVRRGVPTADRIVTVRSQDRLIAEYEFLRKGMTGQNTEAGDKILVEGMILYCRTAPGEFIQLKCKPEQVEDIHFASHSSINRNIVRAAALKVIESDTSLNEKTVNAVLLEDWELSKVQGAFASGLIYVVIEEVVAEMVFRDKVLTAYREFGESIHDNKPAVMRYMSSIFDRSAMQKVYSTILSSPHPVD